MSIKVMTWVWDNSPYSGDGLLIHLALADWANDDGACWPKQTAIATKARCSVEHVRRTIKKMQRDGYLEITSISKGPGSSHNYLLKNPTKGGVLSEESPTSENPIPHIQQDKAPHPSPNNRHEPSKKPSSTVVKLQCPYCKKRIVWGDPHNCPAMNQRIG